MCLSTPKPTPAAQIFAAPDNSEAVRQGELEARLRKRRQGAAANILTSASGIPASPKLGSAA